MKSLTQLTPKVTHVPYDFYYSGFVGSHGLHPQEWKHIETLKDREDMGYCRKTD